MKKLLEKVEPAYVLLVLFVTMMTTGLLYGGYGQVLSKSAVICLDCMGLV